MNVVKEIIPQSDNSAPTNAAKKPASTSGGQNPTVLGDQAAFEVIETYGGLDGMMKVRYPDGTYGMRRRKSKEVPTTSNPTKLKGE